MSQKNYVWKLDVTPFAVHYKKKYTIINANLKLINAKIHSFYSIDIH